MKQKKSTGIILRLLMICLGAALASYGIDLAIHAGFGSATLAVLWQGVSVRFGLTYGVASLLVAAAMVAFCLIYDRSQIHVGTILYQIVYTFAIDFFRTRVYYTESVVLNFGIMLLGADLCLCEEKGLADENRPYHAGYSGGGRGCTPWRQGGYLYAVHHFPLRPHHPVDHGPAEKVDRPSDHGRHWEMKTLFHEKHPRFP